MKGVEELTLNEIIECNGGESLWYWVAYGVGSVGRGVKYVWDKHTEMIMEQGGHVSTMPFK
ncbi:MAG: hypothetical protein HUK10_05995 [Bacteroides heparinolyticus]|nr:hypothetical protein [Bacteroides heparinolyticus]